MCASFVHSIRGLQDGDSKSQTPINLNGPLHSNWAGLPIISNQLGMSIQKVYGEIKLRYNS
jgi:hypothetical protein